MLRKDDSYIDYLKKNKDKNVVFRFFDEAQPIKEYKYWKIIKNTFPYENTKIHHMIVPNRQVGEYYELSMLERAELELIKTFECSEYSCCIRNFNKGRSVDIWYHEHLVVWK